MSETQENHDPQTGRPNSAAGSFTPDAAPWTGPTNRPATGAREVQSQSDLDLGWQGNAGATDFLGLDPEFRTTPATRTSDDAAGAPTPADLAADSWLFALEQGGQAATATSPETDAPESAAEFDATLVADPEQEFTDPSTEIDELAAEPEEAGAEETPVPAPARGRKRFLVGALVLAVAAIGAWFAWQRFGPRPVAPVEVATNTKPVAKPTKAKPGAQPKPGAVTKPDATAPTSTTPPDTQVAQVPPEPDTTASPAPDAASTSAGTPAPDSASAASTPDASVIVPPLTDIARLPIPDSAPAVPTLTPTLTAPSTPQHKLFKVGARPIVTHSIPGGGRTATAEDYAGMWNETTIPYRAIRAEGRVRTLRVGRVRALLTNGEFFEGNLYAVGNDHIWLELPLGRLALDAGDVKQLVQIATIGGKNGKGLPFIETLAGVPRVEVQLQHSSLLGKIIERDGNYVTLMTDQGMRMKVEALDVRPAPVGGSRLVGRIAEKP